jgi:hypothetical protein
MRVFVISLLCLGLASLGWGQVITTDEAQAVADAWQQTSDHTLSFYMLAYCQLIITGAALSLVFNMRSLAFLFLFAYGLIVINVPYYIPVTIKTIFGFAIVLVSAIGLICRFFVAGRHLLPSKPRQ